MSRRAAKVLSPEQLERFERDGYVRLERAFERGVAEALAVEVWAEFAREHGIRRDDPSTWHTPPRSPRGAKHSELNARMAGERFLGAIGDLVGGDDWQRPSSWGGFLVSFPVDAHLPWELPTDGWHWDGVPRSRGLLIFSFYGPVHAGGGGTLLFSGSHRVIEAYYGSLTTEERAQPHRVQRKRLMRWHPTLSALAGLRPVENRSAALMQHEHDVHGLPCKVVELTGEPGDVVFCDLGMLHSAASNRGDAPRLMRSKFLFLEPGSKVG